MQHVRTPKSRLISRASLTQMPRSQSCQNEQSTSTSSYLQQYDLVASPRRDQYGFYPDNRATTRCGAHGCFSLRAASAPGDRLRRLRPTVHGPVAGPGPALQRRQPATDSEHWPGVSRHRADSHPASEPRTSFPHCVAHHLCKLDPGPNPARPVLSNAVLIEVGSSLPTSSRLAPASR